MTESADITKYRQINLMPFQAELVQSVLSAPVPERHLLIAPTGSGKTRAATILVKQVAEANPKFRVLVIGPRFLASVYQHLLAQLIPAAPPTIVTRRVIRELESTIKGTEPIWPAPFIGLIGIDTARQDDVRKLLRAVTWDLVILEEVHLFGRSRWTLLKTILSDAVFQRVLLITATPDLKGVASLLKNVRKTEWAISALKDWNGKLLFHEPKSKVVEVEYKRSDDEVLFLKHLSSLTRELISNRAGELIKSTLLSEATSSLLALERTLRQMRNNLAHSKSELFVTSEVRRVMENITENQDIETVTLARNVWKDESTALRLLENLIDQLDSVGSDKKREAFEGLVESILKNDASNKYACVSCSFIATANYLLSVLLGRGMNAWIFTSSQTSKELDSSITEFQSKGGILVVTAAMLAGLDLRYIPVFIHYDSRSESDLGFRISRGPDATHYILKDTSSVPEA